MVTPESRAAATDNDQILLPLVLVDDFTEGLVVIDPESVIRYANPAMTRIFGYGRDELEGESLTVLVPEELRERHREGLRRYLSTGERSLPWSDLEFPGLHRDGHRLDLRVTFSELTWRGERLFAGTIRDRTAAKDPEEERRILVRSYRTLFEEEVAAVFRIAPDGRVLAANGALARMAGVEDPEELHGRDVREFYAEDESREEFLRDLREQRQIRNRELRLRRADGTTRWCLVNAVWIDDPQDVETEVLVGTVVDISERKRAERELKLSRKRYRRLFEQGLVGVFRSDPRRDGKIVECNQAIADMFGFDRPEEIEGTPAHRFYPGGTGEREDVLEALREAGSFVQYELQLQKRDGSPIWVLAHSRVVSEPSGRELIEALFFDVTDRVRARRQLTEREERFRQMAENIEEVFWLRDPDVEEMLYVSPAYEEIWGRPVEELYREPESWMEAIHPDDRPRVQEAAPEADGGEETEAIYDEEYRIVRPDGEVRWIHDRGFEVDQPGGKRDRVAGVAEDITDRVRAREALVRAEEMFRGVFEISPVALKVVDPETGTILEANATFGNVFGYEDDELVEGRVSTEDLWRAPRHWRRIRQRLGRAGQVRDEEVELRRRDGTVFDALYSGAVLRVGEDPLLVCAVQDISPLKEVERELKHERAQLVEIFREAPAFLAVLRGPDHVFERANPTYRALVGDRELVGRSVREALPELERQPFFDILDEVYRTGEPYSTYEEPIDLDTGEGLERRYLSFVYQPLAEDGETTGVLVHGVDVTEQVESRREAAEKERRLGQILGTATDGILFTDAQGRFEYANPAAEEILGLEASEITGRRYDDPEWEITGPEGSPFSADETPIGRVLNSGNAVHGVEFGVTLPDGSRIVLRGGAAPMRNESGELKGAVATIRDVTDQKQFEKQLRHQALHDQLTGLPNRTLFWDRLEHALDRSQRTGELVAVLFLDLDGFKRINDEHGHGAGDEVLRRVTDRLRSSVREADTLARLGGDEFGVLIEDLEEESDAREAARRLTGRFEAAVPVAGEEALVSVSCGIALAGGGREETVTADELVHRADRAMYVAKDRPGSSSQVYSPEVAGERTGRLRREIELKEALEAGHVFPYYQPIVDLENGRIVGAEALARWEHPGRGLILPGEFIPLAEETGLIVDLGRQVLRYACGQLSGWQEASLLTPDFRLHVNLSARQLDEPDALERLRDMFRELDVDPERVAFEVTESVAVEAAHVLREIRGLGSPVAVDDFGTEYATLERLTETELDSLKLDRSFVGGIGESDRHEAVLEASLTLADSLGLCPVAEGVETRRQRDGLLDRGCRYGQGFLYAEAVPAEEFEGWLREERSFSAV